MVNWEDKKNFKIQNDVKTIEYLENIDFLEKEIQQVNQYKYERFDNGCFVASAISIIGTLFGMDPDRNLLKKFEREAERRGWDLGEDGIPPKYLADASKMIVSYWNSIYEDKRVLFLQDMMFSPTRLLASRKGYPIQYVIRRTEERSKQKKTGRITDPSGEVVSWHALFGVYDTEEEVMTFYDSNEGRAGDEFRADKSVLKSMMKDLLISPLCRIYLPYNEIHQIDPKTYKALQMYKNVSIELMSRVDDERFDSTVKELNLIVDELLGEK